jgi:N-acetylglutamate synthase-like GNAT family acetyltransferase
MEVIIRVTDSGDVTHIENIIGEIELSSKIRGIGRAKRSREKIEEAIINGRGIIAIGNNTIWLGFCYIEPWAEDKWIVNSGLIVNPQWRNLGIAREIKEEIVKLCNKLYPGANIFGLTTSGAVMKINSDMGFKPDTYATIGEVGMDFWQGCNSCIKYDILKSMDYRNCFCTLMVLKSEKCDNKKDI